MKAKGLTMMLAAAGMAMAPTSLNAASFSIAPAAASVGAASYFQDDDDDGGGSTAIILGVVLVVLIAAVAISGTSGEDGPSSP